MNQSFNNNFAAIFGDVIRFASNSQQIIEDCTVYKDRRSTDNMRRIIENADIEYERRITEDRRMHGPECVAGMCCCNQEDV